MAEVNIELMSIEDLEEHAEAVRKLLEIRKAEKRERALEAAKAAVQKFGINFDELLQEVGMSHGAGQSAEHAENGRRMAKEYVNPTNRKETWCGRGRRPAWMAKLIAAGYNQEDFAMKFDDAMAH